MYFGLVGKYLNKPGNPMPKMIRDVREFPAIKLVAGVAAVIATVWWYSQKSDTNVDLGKRAIHVVRRDLPFFPSKL